MAPRDGAEAAALFELASVALEGATALTEAQLEPRYSSFLGRQVSQNNLLAIADSITAAYREAGYHLSRAILPPQELGAGRLRIRIVEGSIDEVVIKGDETNAFGLRDLLAPISRERPSRLETLERRLLLADDRPGLRIADTALEEIGTATGSFRLTVTAETWHAFTAAGIDNLGSAAVGPWESSASVALNSILVPGDSLVFAGSMIPNSFHELRFGRLNYDMPVGTDGVRIGIGASRGDVWPGDDRAFYRTHSVAENYEARASFAPLLSQTHSLWLTGALGVSSVVERDVFGPTYKDRVRLASLSADYRLHAGEGSWTYASATFRQGLGFFDASTDSADWLSRDGASGYFSAFTGSLTHYQTLADDWSLKLAAAGQVASGPLLISQQYYLGGLSFGRGFEGGWLSGDNALAGSAELRYDRPLNLTFAKGFQLYGFVEGGATRTFTQPKDLVQSLASVGAGVRVFINDNLEVGLGVAKPVLYRSPLYWNGGTTVLFSLSQSFRVCPEQTGWRCRS